MGLAPVAPASKVSFWPVARFHRTVCQVPARATRRGVSTFFAIRVGVPETEEGGGRDGRLQSNIISISIDMFRTGQFEP